MEKKVSNLLSKVTKKEEYDLIIAVISELFIVGDIFSAFLQLFS